VKLYYIEFELTDGSEAIYEIIADDTDMELALEKARYEYKKITKSVINAPKIKRILLVQSYEIKAGLIRYFIGGL
jgi:hypothetical protein